MDDGIESLLYSLPEPLRESAKTTLGINDDNDNYRDGELSDEVNKIYKLILEKREFLNSIIANGLNLNKTTISQKSDERFILTALNSNPNSLEFATSVYQDREDIVFSFVDKDPSIYKFVSPRLKKIKELVIQAVKINGLVLEYVSDDLKNDFDVVYEAVKNNGMALKYASYNMRLDRNIVKKAVEENGTAIRYANSKLWSCDKELILIVLKTPGARLYIHDIDDELKNDLDFIIECCKIEPKFFSHASNYVKDILRVQYVKSYVETLFDGKLMEISKSSREDSSTYISIRDKKNIEYYEFDKKKNKFITEVKKYYLNDSINRDLLYEILRNKINYEIDLSISSIVYPITDFNKQFDMFKKSISNTYDFFVNLYCNEYNLPNSVFLNNINYDALPDNFYNQLVILKDNICKKRDSFKDKLLELREKFLFSSEHSIFMDFIDREIGKYIDEFGGSYYYDIESELKSFNKFLDKIERIMSDINTLWNIFYSIDRGTISDSELKYFNDNLSIEGIKKDLESLDLANYELKLKQLKRELSLYDNDDKSSNNIYNIYQLVLDEYYNTIMELSEEPGFYDGNSNYFDVISDVFFDFYDCYSKIFRKSDCSAKDICDLKAYIYEFQDRIHNYRNSEKYAFHIAMFLSLYQNHKNSINNLDYKEALDEFLECRYHFILNEYIEKLSDLRLVNKKNILKAYTKKMAIAHNIYLSYKYGNKNFEEVLKKLNEFDFDNLDSIILIDDIRVGLPLNDEFSGDYFYTVNDFSEGETEIVLTTSDGGHVCKCLSYDYEKTIPLREFIDDMEYAGVWEMGALGIRHIIYKNNEYCLAIQEDIFDNNYFLVLPVSRLNDRLRSYSDDIEEEYREYVSKEKFMNDFEKILEDRYLESINKKEKKRKLNLG